MSSKLPILQDSYLDEMDYTPVDHPDDSDSLVEISSDQNPSSPVTPKSDTIPVDLNFDHQSGSDVSPDHDSDDSSYSELDSEAEAFYSTFNHNLLSSGDMDDHDLAAEKQRSFGLLMKKNAQLEEELRTMTLKLQENEKLKAEAEKRESDVLLVEKNLRCELETARREIEMRNIDLETETVKLKGEAEAAVLLAEKNIRTELETAQREIELRDIYLWAEKRQVLELERKVVDLETKLSESSFKFENLANELKESRESLDVSDAEISKLKQMLCDSQESFSTEKTKLVNDIADLLAKKTFSEEWSNVLEDQIRNYDAERKEMQRREVELQQMLCDSQESFSTEKTKLVNDIADLLAKKTFSEDWNKVLEDQIRNYDAVRNEMQRREVELQAEINALRIELASHNEHVEEFNKAFDKYKHSYDMLMIEKDGVYANLDRLKAEMRSKDLQIKQMEKQINQMHNKQTELEKQVELQRNGIEEAEEEKREAIRQLCFCLDYYQSGYKQLVQALLRNKKQQGRNHGV